LQAEEPIALGTTTPVLPDASADRDRIKISVEAGRPYEIELSGEKLDGNVGISNGFFSVRQLNTVTGTFEAVANTRVWTQSQPEHVDCSERDGIAKCSGELVVARGDATEGLESADRRLDSPSLFVGLFVVMDFDGPVLLAGDHGLDTIVA